MATDIEVIQHEWVAISIEPVLVIQDPVTGEVIVLGDPEAPLAVQYGCDNCSQPLDGHFNTPCQPDFLED